jgi:hypothetical protein
MPSIIDGQQGSGTRFAIRTCTDSKSLGQGAIVFKRRRNSRAPAAPQYRRRPRPGTARHPCRNRARSTSSRAEAQPPRAACRPLPSRVVRQRGHPSPPATHRVPGSRAPGSRAGVKSCQRNDLCRPPPWAQVLSSQLPAARGREVRFNRPRYSVIESRLQSW